MKLMDYCNNFIIITYFTFIMIEAFLGFILEWVIRHLDQTYPLSVATLKLCLLLFIRSQNFHKIYNRMYKHPHVLRSQFDRLMEFFLGSSSHVRLPAAIW